MGEQVESELISINNALEALHQDVVGNGKNALIIMANHGQNVSYEYVLEIDPDYLFVIDRAAVTGGSVAAEQVLDNEMISMTQAYQNDKIVYLNSQLWYVASGGITGTNMMIEEVHAAIK
ncbi:ABC transporter substrate-binding protein [Alkaliphilus metalliredigens]|uniref:ABC transporter substrate-binding protein n=1 Tax=Alkaliphilus metalliredigens TaxID=208226 RepID=UPI00005CBC95|nr:ABC transporter substrate-binding protein [Alkaliphilus metalliredigens]